VNLTKVTGKPELVCVYEYDEFCAASALSRRVKPNAMYLQITSICRQTIRSSLLKELANTITGFAVGRFGRTSLNLNLVNKFAAVSCTGPQKTEIVFTLVYGASAVYIPPAF
jgi:hypothetical protein